MRYQELLEYINYDREKFISKWKAEGSPYSDDLSDGDFASWLEQYDPTPGNKYVNWMIIHYLKNDIKRLEDIPSRISPALDTFMRLGRKKKLKPEHKDINRITNIEDVIDEYKDQDTDLSSKSEVEDKFYKSGDADLVYNDSEYKVVVPKTEEASKYFGRNTRWCTAAENNNMFDMYADDGPLYIILEKASNTRFQFHFESKSYMDEKDRSIKLGDFFQIHKKIFTLFEKLGYIIKPNKESGSAYITKSSGDIAYWDEYNHMHRLDGPAYISREGTKYWYLNGKQHRLDGPAVIGANGIEEWYKDDKLHRADGPAVIGANGIEEWYKDDKLHRTDGPAIKWNNGTQEWFLDGLRHRTDGPALIFANGDKEWYQNGRRHRIDGPAVEYLNGKLAWYLYGKGYSKSEYNQKIKEMNK